MRISRFTEYNSYLRRINLSKFSFCFSKNQILNRPLVSYSKFEFSNSNNIGNNKSKNFIKASENDQELQNDHMQEKISQQYDYTKHTLLKHLYMFNYSSKINLQNEKSKRKNLSDNIVYFLLEPATKSLIAIDLFLDFELPSILYEEADVETLLNFTEKNLLNNLNRAKNLIEKLENATSSKLSHIFLTKLFDKDLIKADGSSLFNMDKKPFTPELQLKVKAIAELKSKINNGFWREFRKELAVVSGNPNGHLIPGSNEEKQNPLNIYKSIISVADKKMNDIETMSIGEICFASLFTPGISDDQYSFVITHVSPTSTKIPFLFPGEVLSIGSCGFPYINKPENCKKLYDSLKMILSLPNDTLVYPKKNSTLENLEVCKKIDTENEFIKEKLKWALDTNRKNENAVGSRLIEEKFINPVFRLDDVVYAKILGENLNYYKKFENFIRLKELIYNQMDNNNAVDISSDSKNNKA